MYSMFCQLPVTIKKSFYLLAFISLGNLIAAPVNAQQAVARGAVSIVSPTGAYQSVSGELFLPVSNNLLNPGTSTTLTVTPTFTNIGTINERITSLSLTVGTATETITNNNNSLLNQNVETVNNLTSITDAASLIETINDTNSLGALE
ncbi:MAG: hypothetical protein RMY62_030235 [Nostoc sp. ZfuVER08]|uniref:Uncharacterized protein n=1 Tax=Nostoc punctiforme FACHB-252 TaxID=1357509 RepID=A0ABR8H5T2_NOSPU|nr:hypothetical protein [Nostoc punctiforme]MBD2610580.1 hypothetical protein [Nostoc punctiforme FACHB-252]MBL1198359.1 hypothetical protein [Nostoc sp. GBBB01]MDZ8011750.1 hypothetical protein [Nostoc sp. ZfuVER08]